MAQSIRFGPHCADPFLTWFFFTRSTYSPVGSGPASGSLQPDSVAGFPTSVPLTIFHLIFYQQTKVKFLKHSEMLRRNMDTVILHRLHCVTEGLTMLFNDISSDRVPRVELGQNNIIFNIPHPSLVLHIHDKTSRNSILLLIQEVKRDIIFILGQYYLFFSLHL